MSKEVKKPLPRVASLQSKKFTSNLGVTTLPCGEQVPKNHKVLMASGSIEEAIALIGRLKAMYFNLEDTNARKMFIFARLTKIQEDLFTIIKSITTTSLVPGKHSSTRFSADRVKELEDAINALGCAKYTGTPGITMLEADLYNIYAVIRRCERQVSSTKDLGIGIVIDDTVYSYMNMLSSYFLHLITHMAKF